MTDQIVVNPSIRLTRAATTLLTQLRRHYQRDLKFRVFPDAADQLAIRLHDKDYHGDWMLDLSDGGLAVAPHALSRARSLAVDCRATQRNDSGFELLLHVNDKPAATIGGDQVINRLLSEETEICDVYGEYCYTSYEAPAAAEAAQV